MVRALAPLGVLLMAAVASASTSVSRRRAALAWPWLDRADSADPAVVDGVPAALDLGPAAPCLSADYRATSRGAGTFDADLEQGLDEATDEAGDDVLQALLQPVRSEQPLSVSKRTLQYLCDYAAVEGENRVCELGYGLLQLGKKHYPHHLNVMQCVTSPHCRPRTYPVPLLTRISQTDEDLAPHGHGPLVPEALREHWRFELKSIPVACEFTHSPDRTASHPQQRGA